MAQDKVNLVDRKHPLYSENEKKWSMYLDSAAGGSSILNDNYLFSHSLEEGDYYDERLNRAYFLNFCDTIPHLYNSFIFRRQVERPYNADLVEFRKNVDGRGTNISNYIRQLGYFASVLGVIHVFIDTPNLGNKGVSKAQAQKILPYCSMIFPTNLVDWSLNFQGNFRWVVLKGRYFADSDPTVKRDIKDYYKAITTDKWWVEDSQGGQFKFEDGIPNSGNNKLGLIPIATMYHKDKDGDKIGESLIKDIFYINRTILNWCSCIDEQIERQTFSQLTMPDDGTLFEKHSKGEDPLLQLSTATIMTFPPDAKHPPTYISPNTENLSAIWKLVIDHIKEIYRLAGLLGGASDLYSQRSGRQSQLGFVSVNSCLAEKAAQYEKMENDISKLVLLQLGKDPEAYEPVKYPDNFDVVAVAEEIDSLFKVMEKNFSSTLNKTLIKNVARRAVSYVPPNIIAEIEKEIEESDGYVESSKAASGIQPEKNGQGNPNTSLDNTFHGKEALDRDEISKKKKE